MSKEDTQENAEEFTQFNQAIRSTETAGKLLEIYAQLIANDTLSQNQNWKLRGSCLYSLSEWLEELKSDELELTIDHYIRASLDDLSTSNSSSDQNDIKFVQYRLRKQLSKFLQQLDVESRFAIAERHNANFAERLEKGGTASLLSTIKAVGIPTEVIVKPLWELAESSHKLSASAVGILIGLGVGYDSAFCESSARKRLIDNGQKMLSRGNLGGANQVVWHLCGPEGMQLVDDLLEEAKRMEDGTHELSNTLTAISHAMNRHSGRNTGIDQRIWMELKKYPKTISMNSLLAKGCRIPEVVSDYVGWACQSPKEDNRKASFRIKPSRIEDLYSPEHLGGFDLADRIALTPKLREVATFDSKITGRFVTAALDKKKVAIEWLQCMDERLDGPLFESIVCDETNVYVADEIARLVSATPQLEFPERIRNLLESKNGLDRDQGEDFFRKAAAECLAHTSGHRDAFLSMTRFNNLHDGNVLLSTIDALVDLAVARMNAGDDDVVHHIDKMVQANATSHHRAAGVAVWCQLIEAGHCSEKEGYRLWNFAMDQTLDEFSHQDAILTFASPNIPATNNQMDWLWEKAIDGQDSQQLQAACAISGRGGLSIDQLRLLIKLLDGELIRDSVELSKTESLTIWQGALLANLFEHERQMFSQAVCDTISNSKPDVIHQLLPSICNSGVPLPEGILESMVNRIDTLNTGYRADTELISALGKLSPNHLIEICFSGKWTGWIGPGRVSLANAIYQFCGAEPNNSEQVSRALEALIRDPSFLVRRCAYRGFSRLQPRLFSKHIEVLASSREPELAKRAAEAIRWLDPELFTDDFIRQLNLESHLLPEVREIAQTAILERRDRIWADDYLNHIEASAKENVLGAIQFRYGYALRAIGDDETTKKLTILANNNSITPRIRFWLKEICKAIKKNWRDTLKKHEEPWSLLSGTVERHDATIHILPEGKSFKAEIHLWKHERQKVTDHYSWGGIGAPNESIGFSLMNLGEIKIEIPGRTICKGMIGSTSFGSTANSQFTFWGKSEWPEVECNEESF